MEISFILDRRLAVGGGIWTADRMAQLAMLGFTHIVNLQSEFDDRELAAEEGIAVFWSPTEDDLTIKPPSFLQPPVGFAVQALAETGNQVYVHCAAGIHRGPLLTAAILCALGYTAEAAMELVLNRRNGSEFPEPYAQSLRDYARNPMLTKA